MNMRTKIKKGTPIKMPYDFYAILKQKHFCSKEQEYFLTMTLDSAHEPIALYIVTIGLVNRTLIHPREVYRPAVKDNAIAIMAAHNHPSGRIEPSAEDDDITAKLEAAGEILGIKMLDHLIVSKTDFYSYRKEGKLHD
jgi:DNA repair protein RadC